MPLLHHGVVVGAEAAHTCALVAEEAARLACYDAAFGKPSATTRAATASDARSVQAAVGATAAAVVAPATETVSSGPHESFGLSEADKRARTLQESAKRTNVSSKVTQVSSRPEGQLLLTLEDGQVWAQLERDTRFRARPGDRVTIRKASLGSYLLVGPDRIATRVRRVK